MTARDDLDETTAAEAGHAFIRWAINTDPGGIGRFLPELEAQDVDDAKAARVGRTIVEVLEKLDVA